jgi:hypothetical protein
MVAYFVAVGATGASGRHGRRTIAVLARNGVTRFFFVVQVDGLVECRQYVRGQDGIQLLVGRQSGAVH